LGYQTIISTDDLESHLEDPHWVLFDCRFTLSDPEAGRSAYAAGHIPGARYVHLNEDLSAPVGEKTGRHPLPDPNRLIEKLGNWGVDAGKQVVVYDDAFGAMAVRMWWLLRWLGHKNIALLDGGYRFGRPGSTANPMTACGYRQNRFSEHWKMALPCWTRGRKNDLRAWSSRWTRWPDTCPAQLTGRLRTIWN
jgi:3-mercaptopyruvate sulfurtransferase SseA